MVLLIKNYDVDIWYYPGKVYVVVDALNRKQDGNLVALIISQRPLLKDTRRLELEIVTQQMEARIASLRIQLTIVERIKVT